ncbi:MAG: toxin-antitoxin system TumE family protein [Methylocella sp.]
MTDRDRSLDTLLDLHGQVLVIDEKGHVVKFVIKRTDVTETRPHGLSYSLTLHDRTGQRLMGFDNAHAVERPGGKFVEQPKIYDHVHRGKDDKGRPYAFVNAGKLIEDFWAEVDRILDSEKE